MAGEIRFDDGASYERMMGTWSRLVGTTFLDWLAPGPALRWADVGCGNGAFTELVAERCSPAAIHGVDPSEAQLAFARGRPVARIASFTPGDAMALPLEDNSFDVAVMALVIFFVPEPARGLAEMKRVVRPGGWVAAYAWDVFGGGLPMHGLQEEMRAMGHPPPLPPSAEVSSLDALGKLWSDGGLEGVATRAITAQRTFDSHDDFWETSRLASGISAVIAKMSADEAARLRDRLRTRFAADSQGRITLTARANAVRGRVPV